MHTASRFKSLRFPWNFSQYPMNGLSQLPKELELKLENLLPGFEYAIQQTVQAMVAQDFEFLKSTMEATLYNEIVDSMNILKRRGHQLKIVNEGLPLYLCLFGEKIYKGLHIDRSKNKGKVLQSLPSFKTPGVPFKNFKIHLGTENTMILKLDIICSSGQKLAIFDEHDRIIFGNDRKIKQSHKFTFECFVQKKPGVFSSFKSLYQTMRYFAFAVGDTPIDFTNWYITDIDDFLEGNPIIS